MHGCQDTLEELYAMNHRTPERAFALRNNDRVLDLVKGFDLWRTCGNCCQVPDGIERRIVFKRLKRWTVRGLAHVMAHIFMKEGILSTVSLDYLNINESFILRAEGPNPMLDVTRFLSYGYPIIWPQTETQLNNYWRHVNGLTVMKFNNFLHDNAGWGWFETLKERNSASLRELMILCTSSASDESKATNFHLLH
ncbi:hypothetical protein ABW21_db0203880 [Orbilia brochopaga]|nr:hypothetical protein ABW21_db0203880 [Drechslerella brochopaga]